jgi:hypothetical protein
MTVSNTLAYYGTTTIKAVKVLPYRLLRVLPIAERLGSVVASSKC